MNKYQNGKKGCRRLKAYEIKEQTGTYARVSAFTRAA